MRKITGPCALRKGFIRIGGMKNVTESFRLAVLIAHGQKCGKYDCGKDYHQIKQYFLRPDACV